MARPKGARTGNKHAERPITGALLRLLKRERKRLDAIVRGLADKAAAGDVAAFRELADRIEGKVPQTIAGTGDGGALTVIIKGQDASIL